MSTHNNINTPRVEAVERALAVLKAFRLSGEELSLAEITRRTGFYKSTILRLAASLIHDGFLVRNLSGSYMLGPELPRLAALCASAVDLESLVRPYLRALVAQTQESASYFVRSGNTRICKYRENSMRAARHHLEEGSTTPLELGASSRVLLAFGSEADSPAYTGIRERGYYLSIGERDPDVIALAVPVIDKAGRLWGALTVSGLKGRFDEPQQEQALAFLRQMANELGQKLPVVGPIA